MCQKPNEIETKETKQVEAEPQESKVVSLSAELLEEFIWEYSPDPYQK